MFKQSHPLRRLCQKFVEPAYGDERVNGRPAVRGYKIVFGLTMFVAILASITIAAIATPLYRLNYYRAHGQVRWTWFTVSNAPSAAHERPRLLSVPVDELSIFTGPQVSESAIGAIFVLEFFVKIIADGFLFSPNAYLLSIWNNLDLFILLCLLVNAITALVDGTGINRFTRMLKATRALRLINLWPTMQTTFYNVSCHLAQLLHQTIADQLQLVLEHI